MLSKKKKNFLLGRKAITNLDSILKLRDINFPTNIRIVKAMFLFLFSSSCVWMWELGHREGWRNDAFKLWCWRRFLRVYWTAKRSNPNQSILKEINPEYPLEGLMLKLKLQYFGHLMWRANSLKKTLILGKTEGRRRRGQQRMRQLDGLTKSMDMTLSKLQEIVKDRKPGIL